MKKILYITGCIVMAFAMMIIGTSEAKAVTATASSEESAAFSADKAIDGVNGWDNRWSAHTAGDAWVQINYDTPQAIQGLVVYPLWWTFDSVSVEYLNDSGNLEAVTNLAVDITSGGAVWTISFCPVNTKSIRLNMINTTGNAPSIFEMEVLFHEAIVASSEEGGAFSADKAIDGVNGWENRWSASTAGDAWIQLNYETPQVIEGLVVYPLWWTFDSVDVEYIIEGCELEAVTNLAVEITGGGSVWTISFCPVTTKGIRLNMINTTGNAPSIFEMAVLFQPSIEASSEESAAFSADKAIDGVNGFDNRWAAHTAGDAWIQINYDTPQVIRGLVVQPLWWTFDAVDIEYVNDNCELEAVTNLAVDITSGGAVWTISFCPVETKGIRLNMINATGNPPSIFEMEVLFREAIEASSEQGAAFSADKAIDGVNGWDNRWSASTAGDAWIQINYDTPQVIEGLVVQPLWWTFDSVDVEYLNENSECELEAVTNLAVEITGGGSVWTISFCPVTTKGIRLNMINTTGNAPSIFEMGVLFQTGIPADCDGDGIPDACEESDIDVLCAELGALIDAQVPPAGSYNNHGQYVSQVAHAANLLVDAECHLSDDDAEDLHSCLVSTRAKSGVGRK